MTLSFAPGLETTIAAVTSVISILLSSACLSKFCAHGDISAGNNAKYSPAVGARFYSPQQLGKREEWKGGSSGPSLREPQTIIKLFDRINENVAFTPHPPTQTYTHPPKKSILCIFCCAVFPRALPEKLGFWELYIWKGQRKPY